MKGQGRRGRGGGGRGTLSIEVDKEGKEALLERAGIGWREGP